MTTYLLDGLGVKSVNSYEMLRTEGAKFIPGPST